MSDGSTVTVATCHLESFLDSHAERVEQIKVFENFFKDGDRTLFAGDFNFGDGELLEEEAIPDSFSDSWKVLHPTKAGFTWDREKNPMAYKGSFPGEASRRLDRIYFSGSLPTASYLIGDKAFHKDSFPSDHFGLISIFELIE